jgi:hypothetical protein
MNLCDDVFEVDASDRQVFSHPDNDAVARLSASLERAEPGVVKAQTLIVLRSYCGELTAER